MPHSALYQFLVVLACLIIAPFTNAQDTAVLVQDSVYTTLTDPTTYIQGVILQNTTAYMYTSFQPSLFWMDLTLVTPSTQDNGSLPLQRLFVDNSSNVQISTAFMDTLQNCVYLAGSDKIYRSYVTSLNTTFIVAPPSISYSTQTSFVDLTNRYGYFVSSATPGSIARLPLDKFNATFITTFPIQSGNVYASAYDAAAQVVYLAAYDGPLEKVSLTSQASMLYNANLTGVNSKVLLLDNIHELLYLCYDTNGGPGINVYDTNLNLQASLSLPSLPGSQCASGAFDLERGEAFFAAADSGSALSLVVNLQTGTVTGFEPVVVDLPQISGLAVLPLNRSLYVVSQSQVVLMTYESSCPNDCSEHGVCNYGNCTCDPGWLTADCSQARCDHDCNNQGLCANGLCVCYSNFTGYNCSVRQCLNACSQHGTCSNAPNYMCMCTGGWSGDDCSTSPPPAPPPTCQELSSTGYDNCIAHTYCGWCGDYNSGTCMEGNLEGPVIGSCIEWNFNQNPEIGIVILICIFLGILGAMLLINIYSAIRIDFRRAKDLSEEYSTGIAKKPTIQEAAALWWRDQRSAKSWAMFEQFQFFTFFTHLSLAYPTTILSMTRFVDWTNLAMPVPFMTDNTIHPEKRTLLGMVQYANGLDLVPSNVYPNNMWWFGLGLLILLFVFGVATLCALRKSHWRTVITCRMVYVLIRFCNLAYMGLCMSTTYAMVTYPYNYRIIVPAVFTFVIFCIGYPVGLYFLLKDKDKQLMNPEFRMKFGCLYVNYKPDQKLFYLTNLMRKGLTGIFVGFLNFSATYQPKYVVLIQAACLAVVQFLYAFRVFRRSPYYDHYHQYLDYFLVIVNIGTIAISMVHYNYPLVAGELIVGLVQALGFIACIMTYIISWLQMGPNFRKFFAKLCGPCSGRNKKKVPYQQNSVMMDSYESGGPSSIAVAENVN